MSREFWDQVNRHIGKITGEPFQGEANHGPGGGCINQAFCLSDRQTGTQFFVKLNQPSLVEMFETEAAGLAAIAATQKIRVPKPLCWGTAGDRSYLVLEWLNISSGGGSWEDMGRNLAELHRHPVGDNFGWQQNNFIGSTRQVNEGCGHWPMFFALHRIGYQVQLARAAGGRFPKAEKLVARIPELLAGHVVRPSLVHGDLWGGNAGFTESGEPVIYDVAVYFADREVDLAMSKLFGGFPTSFYRAYESRYPVEPGFETRCTLYNLYHVLNHFNLFGGAYETQANHMIETLLRV